MTLLVAVTATSIGAAGCSLGGDVKRRGGGGPEQSAGSRVMKFALAGDFQALKVKVPRKPVATVGTTYGGIDFELYAVQRSDKVATVVFALRNGGSEAVDMGPVGQDLDENKTFDGTFVASNVALVDTKGLKEYRSFVDENDPNTCVCSSAYNQNQQQFQPDERRYFATQVAAPPAAVTRVNVRTGLASVNSAEIEG